MNKVKIFTTILCATSANSLFATEKSPNIVLIMVDQLIADGMSCAGCKDLYTPALDRIADNGIRFTKAYVTQPLSSPSRSSLHTGCYPHEIGVIKNGAKFNPTPTFFANIVKNNGYQTAHFGKWHVPCEIYDAGFEQGNTASNDADTFNTALKYLSNVDCRERPYFATISFTNPHNVCELARGWDLPDGDIPQLPTDVKELPKLPKNFDIPKNEPSQIRVVQKLNRDKHYPTDNWNEQEWQEYLWGYYRLIEKVDAQIGDILDAIAKIADRETIVIFTSDHGEGVAMQHWNQKQILYDQSVRVPLIIGSFNGDSVTARGKSSMLVSTSLDIAPTIVNIVKDDLYKNFEGESLWSVATRKSSKIDRQYVYAETIFAKGMRESNLRGRMVRSDRYKYIVYDTGECCEQLFDMKRDPLEMDNLAIKPKYRDLLLEMRKTLSDWMKETSDNEFNIPQLL